MAGTFAVHIGGGAYLDASGNLVFGAPTAAQVYQAPAGFKADAKKYQDFFKELSDLLPRDEDGRKKWREWGVPEGLVQGLSKIAGIVGIAATAISVYLWAVGVMIAIMQLMSDDDGMSPELGRTLVNIRNQLQGMEQIQRADAMIGMHSEFDGRIDLMHGLVTRLVIEKPVGSARAQIFADMRRLVDDLAVPLSRLRDQAWITTYDTDAYKARGFAAGAGLLVFERSDGTLAQVPMAPPNVTTFDYRLGVPMLLYGATAFTGLAQVAMPWFRSSGTYASQLRKTAAAMDRFVMRMQDECLARTEYSAGTVLEQKMSKVHDMARTIQRPRSSIEQMYAEYAVGAFDLVAYNDAFMVQRFGAAFPSGIDLGVRGLFNYDWYPADGLSLDDIAKAANEQSRADYARLQVATGMLRLIVTSAWLRFLSTPPDRSQTVSGSASDTRRLVDESPTTARSPSIFPVGVIEHPATLKRYDARARVRITAQEPGYVPAFHYRVVLRAIDSVFGNGGWDKDGYDGNVWSASYEPTQGDARNKRLRTTFRPASVLSDVVLFEGPSPTAQSSQGGTVNMKATTFDWYVPDVSAGSEYLDAERDMLSAEKVMATKSAASAPSATLEATGGLSIHLQGAAAPASPMQLMGGVGPLRKTAIDSWDTDIGVVLHEILLDHAERRHARVEEVQLSWQLVWNAEKLEVRLTGNAQQRPFQVYVVVEENVYSGESLPDGIPGIPAEPHFREQIHTAFVAELVNQLVFVPQDFFDKERKAIKEGAKMWSEFIRRFTESRVVGPGDPIEFLLESNRALLRRSESTATLATTMSERVEFALREAPELWNAAIRMGQAGAAPAE